jgi:hypothetical protein
MSDAMSKGMEMALNAVFKALGINRDQIFAIMEQTKTLVLSVDECLKRIEAHQRATMETMAELSDLQTNMLERLMTLELSEVSSQSQREDDTHVNGST